MGQDLAAIAPSAIVCAAFLVGVGMVLRRELGPKRQGQRQPRAEDDDDSAE